MPETLKQTFETDIDENTDLTKSYMDKINKSFFTMLKNPTEKEIEKHRKIRDALIAAWLASFFKDFEEQLYTSAQKGIDEADRQLKAKKITQIKDKSITADTFENQVKQRSLTDIEDISLVSQGIKANSEGAIKQLNAVSYDNAKVKQISSDLAADLLERGISFFYDRAGRQWSISEYINMKTMTETISAERLSFFTRAIQYGVDLVRIVHLNLHPTCPLCEPFENKILSLTGHTKGYMTIDEASMYGLFHPRCDHIPEQLELAPKDNGNEGKIKISEANKKRYDYNKKRFGITENINKKIENNSNQNSNEEYKTFKSLYSNANVLAEKIVREKGNTANAVKHMREIIGKDVLNNYYNIGKLNKEALSLLGSETNKIKLSADSLIKNIIKHPDIKFSDYLKIPDILKNYDEIKLDKRNNNSVLMIKKDNKKYQLVIKTTQDRKENYLTSFRYAEH